MLKKTCPNCQNGISLKYAKEYAGNDEIICPYCRKTLAVKLPMALLGSVAVGIFCGMILATLTSLSVTWVIGLTVLFSFIGQSFLEFFLFDLSEKDDTIY